MSVKALEIDNVEFAYGRAQVLNGISFSVDEGEIVTIIGPNGAGKSTLLNVLARSFRMRSGAVRLFGQDTGNYSQSTMVREGLVLVPEGRQVFAALKVEDNLQLGAYQKRRAPKSEEREVVERVFELFPRLKDRRNQLAGTLSGGEQQMLAVGRAMMARPRVMLLDEPSLGLAPQVTAKIMDVLAQLRREEGLTIVLVEQNAIAALNLADRGFLLSGGDFIVQGTAKELRDNPQVQHVYLGGTADDSPLPPEIQVTVDKEVD
jgi:branched-chain amino acid transport system ATP-binding protein